jgi:filamentous hemagglutinin
LKLIGGSLEALFGGVAVAAPDPTLLTKALGSLAALHGADTAVAGWRTLVDGRPVDSFAVQGLDKVYLAAGLTPEQAKNAAVLTDMGIGLGLNVSVAYRLGLSSATPLVIDRSGGGSAYAASVRPGGSGRAFAGHGEYRYGAGDFVVPEGTSVTLWTDIGVGIPDDMGRAIESGQYWAIANNPKWLSLMEGAQTYLPGEVIPNLTLKTPNRLNILANSITVDRTTNLDQLLKPGMGHLDWAACIVCR